VSTWTIGDVLGFDYQSKMTTSILVILILAFLNDLHGAIMRMIRK
jgi:hypothetical protein